MTIQNCDDFSLLDSGLNAFHYTQVGVSGL